MINTINMEDGTIEVDKTQVDNAEPTLRIATRVWLKIGLLSFGGPAAQIALMHRMLVDELKWLKEQQYLNALSFCMLLPGPEAMQLATYAGWRLHGTLGGLVAGLLFVLPGAFVILALALLYATLGDLPLINALFLGIKATVLVIVLEALLRIAKRALNGIDYWLIAGLSFVGIFFLNLSFPLLILGAALYGYLRSDEGGEHTVAPRGRSQSLSALVMTIMIWLGIWVLPLLAIALFGGNQLLIDIGAFFSRLAVVTFGGAYAVLAYMGQEVVDQFGWLTAGEMMDGLGLAETTPGPLILVTEFVGFLAGYREQGVWLAIAAATVTLWVTFVPCFLWIFAGAPHIEWICSQPRLRGALSAISAAVVGVILNLSLWFALHVVFRSVTETEYGILRLWQPEFASVDWRVVILSLMSALLVFNLHWGIVRVLAVSAVVGLIMVYGGNFVT